LAQAELGREFRNISGRRAVRIALRKPRIASRPSARFIPKRLINLVGKWVAHGRLASEKHRELILTLSGKRQERLSN
jgi:hypothetical protein